MAVYYPHSQEVEQLFDFAGCYHRVADACVLAHIISETGLTKRDDILQIAAEYLWDHFYGEPDNWTPDSLLKDFKAAQAST